MGISPKHQNYEIIVPTPHNYLLIMRDRDKNLKVLMLLSQDIAKEKFTLLDTNFKLKLKLIISMTELFDTLAIKKPNLRSAKNHIPVWPDQYCLYQKFKKARSH